MISCKHLALIGGLGAVLLWSSPAFAEDALVIENGTGEAVTSVTLEEAPVSDTAQTAATAADLPTEITVEDVTDVTPAAESTEEAPPEPVEAAAPPVEENCLATLAITMADGETIETPTLDLCHVSKVVIGESAASALPLETSGLPPD
jgi:hypothetical protein